MHRQFIRYMTEQCLAAPDRKVLAAVSGGIDSMVMLRLLHQAAIDCAVAHCNFRLRGDDSDGDELLVKEKAAEYGYTFHTIRFDTEVYAREKGLSIQMAARELRYRRFDELAGEHGYDYIAVAHNRDDRIETLLINLARGTGIRGLTSMKPANGKVIRPLLFASRDDITAYAETHRVAFREDSSNASDKYARNYIRHHVIPGLEQYFPDIRQAIENGIEHFSGTEAFCDEAVERYRRLIVRAEGDTMHIDLPGLLESPSPKTLLYEILRPFGFSDAAITDILSETRRQSGRQFYSDTHRLLRDRQRLIVQPSTRREAACEYAVDDNIAALHDPVTLRFDKFDIDTTYTPERNPHVACLDYDKLRFPLLLRTWRQGDFFLPLGMKNKKKLSDFFTDGKISLFEKERCRVLVSDDKIVWVIGMRIDDRFKITDKTKRVLRIEYFFH